MSRTYNIICDDCKSMYWAGESKRIYYSLALDTFLYLHVGHRLRFVGDDIDGIEDYKYVGNQDDED